MSFPDDKFNLKDKSNEELHDWLAGFEEGSPEYVAGIEESMRRIADIEQKMETEEAPVLRREGIAMVIAVLAIAVIIVYIVMTQ